VETPSYALDLTNSKETHAKAKWSAPDHITVTQDGLGWGSQDDQSTREVWLQTEPIGIGLSWRPPSMASIRASVERPGTSGMLYAHYSADGVSQSRHLADVAERAGNRPGFQVESINAREMSGSCSP
jgi:hypothetical protein